MCLVKTQNCTQKSGIFGRILGYKELCIHMVSDHGGLEEVMAKDEREGIRPWELVEKIRR